MNEDASGNFGILVAYLIPGAITLLGFAPFLPLLQSWFVSTPPSAPTLGGFLFLTVASLAAGMAVNALRWALIDTLHAHTGVPMPRLDFSKLGSNVEAFRLLIQIHYQHYQYFSNSFVAIVIAYFAYRVHVGLCGSWGFQDVGVLALEAIFFLASRDTLQKYLARSQQLLQSSRAMVIESEKPKSDAAGI